ncbi:hypothetical protein [Hyphomonas sp.]|uniref:hypothetical protein n=1 Tax=Hyphomonas sp. TaxID=87 RepID=UPI00391C0688
MKRILTISMILSLGLVTACETIQAEDRRLLGEATRANIAEQAVRDVDLPNSKAVESASGVRAVAAVKALNEGQTKQLASSGGTGVAD